ncbi:hypothetical protein Acr_16g0001180 [Actinidia rufa]|uniref:Transposase (putative) gypsy type domain-containing protein n=1 Tax=Actinidia rufa TaxID=165716 RepID=A0A7J0FY47_9ERIC|nr:hypothetical protein Acr_16g0001180 [Actinidia rufa]
MEGSPALDTNLLAAIHPSVEEKTNIMTLEELNALKETYFFLSRVRVRLPEEGETIISARLGEVAFYEAAFPVGLRFPIHPTIRLILQFYNICPAQLVPNAWRSIACSMAMWRARNKKTLLGGYPSNVKGWKSKFFFVSGDEWEFPEGSSQEGAPRVPKTWGVPSWLILSTLPLSLHQIGREDRALLNTSAIGIEIVLPSIYFLGFHGIGDYRRGTSRGGETPSSSGDVAMSKRISFKKLGEKLGKSATVSSGTPSPVKGVVIGEKRTGESLANSPSKKRKVDDGSKGKGSIASPKARRRRPLRAKLRPLQPRLRHALGKALVLSSSLVVRSRKVGEHASLQKGRAASMETEVNDELAKTKSDRDSLADKFERSGVLVVELREALDKAKESTVEEFKSSLEFVVAVEDSTSKYFGEGFDFFKVQLRQHHPDLTIDLEGTVVDQDLLAEQDEAAEEKKKKKSSECLTSYRNE